MRPGITLERHWLDLEGNPDGGIVSGEGFTISWQRGPQVKGGIRNNENGATIEAVVAAVQGRLAFLEETKFACAEYTQALQDLNRVMHRLYKRTNRRSDALVNGENRLCRGDRGFTEERRRCPDCDCECVGCIGDCCEGIPIDFNRPAKKQKEIRRGCPDCDCDCICGCEGRCCEISKLSRKLRGLKLERKEKAAGRNINAPGGKNLYEGLAARAVTIQPNQQGGTS